MSLLCATGIGLDNIKSMSGTRRGRPSCAVGPHALLCDAYRCSTKWVKAPSASCIHQPSPSALAASRSAFTRQCSMAAWIGLMGLAYSAACPESGLWGAERQKHQPCCWRVTAAYGRCWVDGQSRSGMTSNVKQDRFFSQPISSNVISARCPRIDRSRNWA
jgi:hypothetical protein